MLSYLVYFIQRRVSAIVIAFGFAHPQNPFGFISIPLEKSSPGFLQLALAVNKIFKPYRLLIIIAIKVRRAWLRSILHLQLSFFLLRRKSSLHNRPQSCGQIALRSIGSCRPRLGEASDNCHHIFTSSKNSNN